MSELANQRVGESAGGAERALWEGVAAGRLMVRLPGEAEWEKAARGGEEIPGQAVLGRDWTAPAGPALRPNDNPRRRYPWGDEPDPDRANYGETGVGGTSAAGCFPGGVSPYGVLDMSGNVLEWCVTRWQGSYEDYHDDSDPGGSADRVLRGGAFGSNPGFVRCASRYANDPDDVYSSVGFRVVVAPG